jgi:hypothetical protein
MLNYIWAFLLLTGMCAAALLGNVSGDGGIVAAILSKSKAPSWTSPCRWPD